MNIYPDRSGRFSQMIYFEPGEIDNMMEELYLEFFDGRADFDNPALPIDDFMEFLNTKGIEFDPETRFDAGAESVLGRTVFNKDGSALIQISDELHSQRSSYRYHGRYNFTVSHEVFHALNHRVLFQGMEYQGALFESDTGNEIQCLNRDVFPPKEKLTKTPPHEVQANMGASALLMPKSIFTSHFTRERNSYGISSNGDLLLREDAFVSVVGYLSKAFGASKQAVKIRLGNLGLLHDEFQEEFEQFGRTRVME